MEATLIKSIEQAQIAETAAEESTLSELQSVELAYVGGGMGILCWG